MYQMRPNAARLGVAESRLPGINEQICLQSRCQSQPEPWVWETISPLDKGVVCPSLPHLCVLLFLGVAVDREQSLLRLRQIGGRGGGPLPWQYLPYGYGVLC
jgi:hypothetical protein